MLGSLIGWIAVEIELIGLTLISAPGSEVNIWDLGKSVLSGCGFTVKLEGEQSMWPPANSLFCCHRCCAGETVMK